MMTGVVTTTEQAVPIMVQIPEVPAIMEQEVLTQIPQDLTPAGVITNPDLKDVFRKERAGPVPGTADQVRVPEVADLANNHFLFTRLNLTS